MGPTWALMLATWTLLSGLVFGAHVMWGMISIWYSREENWYVWFSLLWVSHCPELFVVAAFVYTYMYTSNVTYGHLRNDIHAFVWPKKGMINMSSLNTISMHISYTKCSISETQIMTVILFPHWQKYSLFIVPTGSVNLLPLGIPHSTRSNNWCQPLPVIHWHP